jgi:DNA-binding NtrC family response regulator
MSGRRSSYPIAAPMSEDGIRILVVDDEPGIRRYVSRVLEDEGFAVGEAKDGVDALEQIRAAPDIWHLVVSDIVMPRCNGVELHEELARLAPALPIILMSGYATADLIRLGIAAPCSVLVKPFGAERLLDEVRRCLPIGR